jgi:hypothetical protein
MKNHQQIQNDELMIVIKIMYLSIHEYALNQFRLIVFAGKFTKNSKFGKSKLIFSLHLQMLSIQRQSQPLARSSSVHDLDRHEVFRANQLDFGPIIGQGFYGIARTVS